MTNVCGTSVSSKQFVSIVRRALRSLQYRHMAEIVASIGLEVQDRNSIGVNLYTPEIARASRALMEISGGEVGNFTSELGPKETAVK